MVQNDAIIVSGLALGCDTIAHDQAIKSQGVTVAILPSTLNKIIPKENRELAEEIVNTGGLLITEYYDEAKSVNDLAGRFIKRDRLQALFSDVVVLSASYTPESKDPKSEKIDSGSRHAMGKAQDYGITRAVIYNEQYSNNPKYDLNRQILQEDKMTILIDTKNISNGIDHIINKSNSSISSQDNIFSLTNSIEETKLSIKRFILTRENNYITFSKGNNMFSAYVPSERIECLIELLDYH